MSEYPEHDKLKAIQPLSQAVGDFIEWLSGQGLWICEHRDTFGGEWVPALRSRDQLLAKHFEIDLDKLEGEKRVMLKRLNPDFDVTESDRAR